MFYINICMFLLEISRSYCIYINTVFTCWTVYPTAGKESRCPNIVVRFSSRIDLKITYVIRY